MAPKPEPLMVTREPGAPDIVDNPVIIGFGIEAPSEIETLSIVAVAIVDPPPVVAVMPT